MACCVLSGINKTLQFTCLSSLALAVVCWFSVAETIVVAASMSSLSRAEFSFSRPVARHSSSTVDRLPSQKQQPRNVSIFLSCIKSCLLSCVEEIVKCCASVHTIYHTVDRRHCSVSFLLFKPHRMHQMQTIATVLDGPDPPMGIARGKFC